MLPMCQSGGFVSSPGFVLVLCFLSSLVIMKLPMCQGEGFMSSPVFFSFGSLFSVSLGNYGTPTMSR